MLAAFATPSPFASRPVLSVSRVRTTTTRPRISMASISRPGHKTYLIDIDDQPATKTSTPEITAISAIICDFMNKEHVRDIANYVVRFGNKFDDLSQLSAVQLTGLDMTGFTADVISCDDSSHCVCVQERLDWPLGLCHNAADIITAFKHLSMLCGLPADF